MLSLSCTIADYKVRIKETQQEITKLCCKHNVYWSQEDHQQYAVLSERRECLTETLDLLYNLLDD